MVAYLEGLARRGHTIHLLTFEPKLGRDRATFYRDDLQRRGISWHSLRYHKRPSLPATIYDGLVGAVVAARLMRRHRLDTVHARSHVPAATGLIVRRLLGCRLIFDIRGLLAEEYVDAGRWRPGGVPYQLTRWIERRAIQRADGIVMLTERVRSHLFGADARPRTAVIPCCADLDRLEAAPGRPAQVRARLELAGRSVLVYVGKLDPPYMPREMVEFFAVARRSDRRLAFLVLTQAPPQAMLRELARADIPESDYRITRCEPGELGDHLAVADFAVCFCRPSFARIASSPTKIGEYLGAGLPVVSGPGIGDVDGILGGRGVGAVVESFGERSYEHCAKEVRELASDPASRGRCQEVARQTFSLHDVGVPAYDRLYREVAAMKEPGR